MTLTLGAFTQATSLGWLHIKNDFGAKGDGRYLTDGAITAGQATLSSTSAAFTSADAGKPIVIRGAAGGSNAPLVTTISSVSGGVATLAATASATVSNASFWYGTDDTAAFQAAINAANTNGGGTIWCPRGMYMIGAAQTSGSVSGTGVKVDQTFTYSGQLLFPARPINGGAPITVQFMGETMGPQVWWSPNFAQADQFQSPTGAVLVSTAMTGSVFDCISDPSGTQSGDIPGGMTAIMPSFRAMSLFLPLNSAANAIEAQYAMSFDMKDCTIGPLTKVSHDVSYPPLATGVGLSLPRRGNAAYVVVRDSQVFALGKGVRHSEHCLLDYVTLYWMPIGIEALDSGHLSEYRRVGIWDCGTVLYSRGGAGIVGSIAVESVANFTYLVDDNSGLRGSIDVLNGTQYALGFPIANGAAENLNVRNLGVNYPTMAGWVDSYPWDSFTRAGTGTGLGMTDKSGHPWQAGGATAIVSGNQLKSNGSADQVYIVQYNKPRSRIVQATITTHSTAASINVGLLLGYTFPKALIVQLDGANNKVNLLKRTAANTFTTLAAGSAGSPGVAAATTYTVTAVVQWSADPSKTVTVTAYLNSTLAVTYTLNGTDQSDISNPLPQDGAWFNSDSGSAVTAFRCYPQT